MIGIPLGLLYANGIEWTIHKYVLHGLGKDRKSTYSYHYHDHHKACRKNDFIDSSYKTTALKGHKEGHEIKSLTVFTLVHLPIAPVAPFFAMTGVYCAFNYYRKHKKSHLDKDWANKNLPWHVDHHMGKNADANWCVTQPWFDHLMGTRIDYSGLEKPDLVSRTMIKTRKKLLKVKNLLSGSKESLAAL